MNKNDEESFIQSLKREYKIYYIERLVGVFSLRFSFFEESYLSAMDFIDTLFQDYIKNISEVRIYPIIKLIKSNKSINCGVKKTFMEFFDHTRQYRLGKKAKEILKELNKNPRHSILEIAEKLGFSRDFIKKTIVNMEKEKLIVGYSIEIDPARIGNMSKLIAIELNLVNKQRLKEIINYLNYESGIQTVSLYFPRNFIVTEMIIKTNTEFRDFQIRFMDKFKDDIAKLEVLDYYDEPKYSYMDEFLENAI